MSKSDNDDDNNDNDGSGPDRKGGRSFDAPGNMARIKGECEKFLASPQTYNIDEEPLLDLVEDALDFADYTSAWILVSIGLRLYPDNEMLIQHQAFLLYETGNYDYALAVLGRIKHPDLWAQSIRVLITSVNEPEKLEGAIRALLAQGSRLPDEVITNLLGVMRDTDMYDLMLELLPQFEEHADHPQTVWRDVVSWARVRADNSTMKRCVEKYVDTCPYDTDAWEMRARYYMESESDIAEARTSVEYALAIDPDSITAELAGNEVEMQSLRMRRDDREAIDRLFVKITKKLEGPLCSMLVDQLYQLVMDFGMLDDPRVEPLVYELVRRYPSHRGLVDLMLRMSESRGEWEIQDFVLRQFHDSDPHGEGNEESLMVSWSRELVATGNPHASLAVLKTYYDPLKDLKPSDAYDMESYLLRLYLDGRYEEIETLQDPGLTGVGILLLEMFRMLAMARLGHYDSIIMVIGRLAMHGVPMGVESLLESFSASGILHVMMELGNWSRQPRRIKSRLADIDPYYATHKALRGS